MTPEFMRVIAKTIPTDQAESAGRLRERADLLDYLLQLQVFAEGLTAVDLLSDANVLEALIEDVQEGRHLPQVKKSGGP